MLRSIHLLVLIASCLAARAQFFTVFGPEDGLGNEHVVDIFPDPKGFVWVSTLEGIFRFDGEHFKQYVYDPQVSGSIGHDHVHRMSPAPDGRIWFTTGNGQLNRYDPFTDRFHSWEQLTEGSDPTDGMSVLAVHCQSSDSIYVSAQHLGLVLFLPKERRHEVLGPARDGYTRSPTRLVPSRSDSTLLWMTWQHEVLLFDTRQRKFVPHGLPGTTLSGERPVMIQDIHVDAGGKVWLATWGTGLLEARRGDAHWKMHLWNKIRPLDGGRNVFRRLLPSGPGKFFIASEDGLISFDPGSGDMRLIKHDPEDPHSLPAGWVNTMALDREGVMWIGTSRGLAAWDAAQNRFVTVRVTNPPGMKHQRPWVNGVAEVNRGFLLGTAQGQGVLVMDPDRPGPPVPMAQHLTKDIHGFQETRTLGLLAFTDAGIFQVDRERLEFRPVLQEAFRDHGVMYHLGFLEDHVGEFWVGAQHAGIFHVEPSTGKVEVIDGDGPTRRKLSGPGWCAGIAEDRDRRIWVTAEHDGLDRISADRERIDHFLADSLEWLPTDKIWDLAIDGANMLWIGTNGEGIIKTPAHDPGGPGTVQLLRTGGLPARITTVFVDRDGLIWAAGPSGLFRIHPEDHSVRRFDQAEGLRRNDLFHASITQHPSGMISITTALAEVVFVDPRDLKDRKGAVPVHISEVRINGDLFRPDTVWDLRQRNEFDHRQNFLEIDYTATAFTLRSQIRLAHQLLGVNDAPIRTGASGRAVYTDLPPGAYRLVISSFGSGDVQGVPVKEFDFVIRPAYWQTGWFKALIALIVLSVGLALVRWRLSVVRDRERLQAEHQIRISEVEMQALRAQMNPHFLFNSLNSINRYIVKNEPHIASEYLTKFSRLMRNVLQNSKERLVPLKDELETLRLYIELESLRFSNRFVYEARIELTKDPATIMVPPMLLQPYVENAIWHGLMHRKEEGGRLSILVHKRTDSLVIEIEDNGVGRRKAMEMKSKSATKQRSMGMQITKERMELAHNMHGLHTRVEIIDLYDDKQRPAGTKVIIRMSH